MSEIHREEREGREGRPPSRSSFIDHGVDAGVHENGVPVREEAKSVTREFQV